MANVFNSVKGLHPRRNAFSAHTYRNDFTGYLGLNIPVYQQHVTAGTRVKVATSALVRLQALISPVMDNIDYYVHFWKIPYRLLEYDRFTQFISGEIDPAEYTALFVDPHFLSWKIKEEVELQFSDQSESVQEEAYDAILGNGGLLDFLGYDLGLFMTFNEIDTTETYDPKNYDYGIKFNLRPLFAYYMLHEHWYMNENVPYFTDFVDIVETAVKNQDLDYIVGLLVSTIKNFGFSMLPHGWEKDYFTSALPNVQYGDPVTINVGGSAPVVVSTDDIVAKFIDNSFEFEQVDSDYDLHFYPINFETDNSSRMGKIGTTHISAIDGINELKSVNLGLYTGHDYDDPNLHGSADLSEATGITINELRFANALQVFKERELRYGRRRLEYYKGFFDVTPEDLRLQVPKYLGGGRIPINIADIEQTSQTSGSQALGHLAGKATAVAGGFAGFNTYCSEESIIIGIAFAMPHIAYANSVSKFLFKTNDKYDYFNPSFEHLGEQAILNCEIFAGSTDPTGEFGYTPRYNEYRFHANEMHGQFKDSLAFWTLGRIFESQPALNADFIYMQPKNFDRIFAVSGQPNMLVSMLFRTRLIQPVSKYGTPMLLA